MNNATPWYDRTWLVVLLLIVFFPVGLFALWKSNIIGKGWKIAVSLFFVALVLVNYGKEPMPVAVEPTPAPVAKVKAPESKSLNEAGRRNYEKELRTIFLDQERDIKVTVKGSFNEILHLQYVLFNDVWFHKFETGGLFDVWRELGFRKVILTDGYNYTKEIAWKQDGTFTITE